MIRATITVSSIEMMEAIYEMLTQIMYLQVLRIKNKLNSELANVSLNFVYFDSIIGEI